MNVYYVDIIIDQNVIGLMGFFCGLEKTGDTHFHFLTFAFLCLPILLKKESLKENAEALSAQGSTQVCLVLIVNYVHFYYLSFKIITIRKRESHGSILGSVSVTGLFCLMLCIPQRKGSVLQGNRR
jgi:hypothetical protein